MRNPNWTEPELILALDLYFRVPRALGDPNHPAVIQLSETLNHLGIHQKRYADEKFCNPNGVATKLSNFRSIDPNHPGGGLDHSSKLDQVVWEKYAGDIHALKRAAKSVMEEWGEYSAPNDPRKQKLEEKLKELRRIIDEIERLI